ncbi:uncharacterized protein [Alexandromys fortis]|uniref:uncharacterized protein n=1 Tax=Alexandromys fortis TaxID=100897 RepID=UPI002152D385|nr:uncharacterized protein LOC126496400 [Microtus fortis]
MLTSSVPGSAGVNTAAQMERYPGSREPRNTRVTVSGAASSPAPGKARQGKCNNPALAGECLPSEAVPALLRAPRVEQLFPSESVTVLLRSLAPVKVITSGLCSGKNVKPHCTTNLTQEIYWEGRIQESGCLRGEKQRQIEQGGDDTGLRGWSSPGSPGIGGCFWSDSGLSSRIGGGTSYSGIGGILCSGTSGIGGILCSGIGGILQPDSGASSGISGILGPGSGSDQGVLSPGLRSTPGHSVFSLALFTLQYGWTLTSYLLRRVAETPGCWGWILGSEAISGGSSSPLVLGHLMGMAELVALFWKMCIGTDFLQQNLWCQTINFRKMV